MPAVLLCGAVAGAGLLGLTSAHLLPVVIGLAALAPVVAHVRHVGVRRAISEPSPITFIVAFYVLVFPARGLVMAATHYTDAQFGHMAVTGKNLTDVLLLASLGTTLLVEGYYFTAARVDQAASLRDLKALAVPSPTPVVVLAGVLGFIALTGLVVVIGRYGGIAGAQAALLSHSKEGPLTSDTSLTDSAWQLFAGPSVWAATYVATNPATPRATRGIFAAVVGVVLVGMLVVYGSRLDAILALFGSWLVLHYSGRRVPMALLVALIPAFAVVSVLVLSSRTSSSLQAVSKVERYSRIAGYGVLDVSLAIWQDPAALRQEISRPNRWLDLPGYLVPARLWPGRPDINPRRLDVYVAKAIGTPNDRYTGFPPTYLMEDWLLGGWPLVLVLSGLGGAAIGWADKRLVRDLSKLTPGRVLAYCFVATAAFNYYKDGDILTSSVGDIRLAIYLSLLLFVTRVWKVRPSVLASRARRSRGLLDPPDSTQPQGSSGAM